MLLDETINRIRTAVITLAVTTIFASFTLYDKWFDVRYINHVSESFVRVKVFDIKQKIEIRDDEGLLIHQLTKGDIGELSYLEVIAHLNYALPAYTTRFICEEMEPTKGKIIYQYKHLTVRFSDNECRYFHYNKVLWPEDHEIPSVSGSNALFRAPALIEDIYSYENSYESLSDENFCKGYFQPDNSCDQLTPLYLLSFEDYEEQELLSSKWRLFHQISNNHLASIELSFENGEDPPKLFSLNNAKQVCSPLDADGEADCDLISSKFKLSGSIYYSGKYLSDLKEDFENLLISKHGINYQSNTERTFGFYKNYSDLLRQNYQTSLVPLPVANIQIKTSLLSLGTLVLTFSLAMWLYHLLNSLKTISLNRPSVPWLMWVFFIIGRSRNPLIEIAKNLISLILLLGQMLVCILPFVTVSFAVVLSNYEAEVELSSFSLTRGAYAWLTALSMLLGGVTFAVYCHIASKIFEMGKRDRKQEFRVKLKEHREKFLIDKKMKKGIRKAG